MIRILLIDDHEIVRRGVWDYLARHPDIEVAGEAQTAQGAVDAASQILPDLAILDISLPDQSGIQTIKALHEAAPDLKVIIYSMHSALDVANECIAAGAAGYVNKTSSPETLLNAIRTVHRGEQFIDQQGLEPPKNIRVTDPAGISDLSPRQIEILCLLARGEQTKEIAHRLGLSPKTVETHRAHLMQRIKAQNVADLVRFAMSRGLI